MHIGPKQELSEPRSVFRSRQMFFSAKCFFAFGVSLILLLALGPNVKNSTAPTLIMFIYIALPLGTGMALLATLAFAVGSRSAAYAESSVGAARIWSHTKVILVAILLVPISAGAMYYFTRGVVTLEVPALLARRGPAFTTWNATPLAFALNMLLLALLGMGAPYALLRKWRAENDA